MSSNLQDQGSYDEPLGETPDPAEGDEVEGKDKKGSTAGGSDDGDQDDNPPAEGADQ